jgi:arabinan endo-1,5-alpha-L-arabinosidase
MLKKVSGLHAVSAVVVLCLTSVYAQKDYGVHDPSTIVKENDRYYTFYTSNNVEYAYSTDLCTWHRGGTIFSSGFPSWIKKHVTSFAGHFWAPDIFYMNNRWHVYYSCSSIGSRVSAIGLATTTSLRNPGWEDQGMVVSTNNSSNHNAIDAAIMRHDGKVWLAYGSFWSGIVMTELDSTTGKPVNKSNLKYVANNDPEAAAMLHHGDYYYLFFNRGKCCDGLKSTYYINVGSSTSPTGPYLDKSGKNTNSGGGTTILKTEGRFIGPGHFGFFSENGKEYMSYHFYDKNQNGASKLKISTLSWKDGWPEVNTDFNPCTPVVVNNCIEVNRNGVFKAGYTDGIITFFMEKESFVKMQLFTISGKVVLSSVSRGVKAGVNHLSLDGSVTGSRGLYLFVLEQESSGVRYEKIISIM